MILVQTIYAIKTFQCFSMFLKIFTGTFICYQNIENYFQNIWWAYEIEKRFWKYFGKNQKLKNGISNDLFGSDLDRKI